MYELLPHTADVRMRVTAPDLATLLRDAMRGMVSILGPAPSERRVRERVHVESADRTALVVDFLGEVLARTLTRRAAYVDLERLELDEEAATLDAEIAGFEATEFADDIKAVTYHEAELTKTEVGWEITVIFDV